MREKTRALIKYKYHEDWINSLSTEPFELDKGKTLQDYITLMNRGPENIDVYHFYRSQLFRLYKSTCDDVTEEFFRVFTNIETINPEAYNEIIAWYSQTKFAEKFSITRDNSYRVANLFKSNKLSSQLLFYYQQVYETESVLDILLTISTYLKQNVVDFTHANFSDRRGKLKKGSTIQYIVSCMKEYEEICENVRNGYVPKVRNSIGHNNYKFSEDNICDLDGNFIASKEELLSSLYSLQEIHNSILNVFSAIISKRSFADGAGCVGCTYITNHKRVTLRLYVLWCFYEEVNYRKICQDIFINIDSKELSTQIGKVKIIGRTSDKLTFVLSNTEIFNVEVISIRPLMSLDVEEDVQVFEMNDIDYEVVEGFNEDIKLKKKLPDNIPTLNLWIRFKHWITLKFFK